MKVTKDKQTRKSGKTNNFFAVSLIVLVAVMAAVGFTLFSITNTVKDLRVEISRTAPDAVLASANLDEDTTVTVPVVYYDQVADACGDLYSTYGGNLTRQFEWTECGYLDGRVEEGIVEAKLGDDYLPVAIGGSLTPNRAVSGDNFRRWFSQIDGISKSYASNLAFNFDVENEEFNYSNGDFYPLDSFTSDKGRDGHNHLFTLNLGVPIQVLKSGEEEFEITADDDTWVFVGDKLVLDMGGVHGATNARFLVNKDGEIYSGVGAEDLAYSGVRFDAGDTTIVRIFHADRDSESSVFRVKFHKMVLNITDSKIAKGEAAQIAYDPANPSYIPPLGESTSIRPDRSNSILAAAITETLVLSVLMVVFVVSLRVVLKKARM